MKFLVLFFALAMPAISWLSQREVFGPDNATVSGRYPSLLVPAGYAFAIWGLIFLLDLVFAAWQVAQRRSPGAVDTIRPAAALGFAMTALWMVVFPQQRFWLALVIIWTALAALLTAALQLTRARLTRRERWLALLPLSLHAGWLSLAAFVNTAQVVLAYGLLSPTDMLPWSLVLWMGAGALLLWGNGRLRGQPAYAAAALWGLAGVYVKQHGSTLAGADASAWVAVGLGAVLLAQTVWLRLRRGD